MATVAITASSHVMLMSPNRIIINLSVIIINLSVIITSPSVITLQFTNPLKDMVILNKLAADGNALALSALYSLVLTMPSLSTTTT